MRLKQYLVIMVKAPRIGFVKSRLASEIGLVSAWTFYRRNMADVAKRLNADRRWETILATTPQNSTRYQRIWPIKGLRLNQGSGDIGNRMKKIMKILPPGPIVIIGSDIPNISLRHINNAFKSLGHSDIVFGPSYDGGYWLVGLRRRPKLIEIFDKVNWVSQNTLSETIATLPKKLKINVIETLVDVDDLNSLMFLKQIEAKTLNKFQKVTL